MNYLLLLLVALFLTACQTTAPEKADKQKTAPSISQLSQRDDLPTAYFDQPYAHLIDLQALIKRKSQPSLTSPVNHLERWQDLDIHFHAFTIIPITSQLLPDFQELTGDSQAVLVLHLSIENETAYHFEVDFDNFYLQSPEGTTFPATAEFINSIAKIPPYSPKDDRKLTQGYFTFQGSELTNLHFMETVEIHLPLQVFEGEELLETATYQQELRIDLYG